jgi:hypothetical protein
MRSQIIFALLIVGAACTRATQVAPKLGDLTHSFQVQARLRSVSAQFVHVPSIQKQQMPQYPDSMRLAQIAGEGRAWFELAPTGEVRALKVRGTTKEFRDSVSAAVKSWKFGPVADHQQRPVEVTLVYDFRFEIIEVAYDEGPNKAPEPTPTSVTSPAAQEPRQP